MKYPNIKLINQKNRGVGYSRNRGIEEAKGDYIFFMDADDKLAENGLDNILKKIDGYKCLPDIIVFDRQFHFSFKNKQDFSLCEITSNIYFEGRIGDFIKRHGLRAYCTSFLFKNDVLKNIRFNDFKIGEDLRFMFDIYDRIDLNTVAFDTKLYIYLCHSESTVHSIDKPGTVRFIENYIDLYKDLKDGKLLSLYPKFERLRLVRNDINYCVFIKILAAGFYRSEIKDYLHRCNEVGMFDFGNINSRLYNMIGKITKTPTIFYLASLVYRKFYLPYIKKE